MSHVPSELPSPPAKPWPGDGLARLDRGTSLVAAAVFASFLLFSALRMPVPAPNEPHYLPKARHSWQPDWCPGDFFLNSADAHPVFFQTVGWLTCWTNLETAAWIGRALALGLLAVGWTAFVTRLVPGRWSPLWAAWAFLAMAAVGNLSGEWIVGGVEAKVFSYGLVFLGLALFWDRRWNVAALCGGLAVAFHPIVGIWSLVCAVFAATALNLHSRRAVPPKAHGRRLVGPIAILIVSSLPGLVPALQMLGRASPEVAHDADYIQVFFRLSHHLDPLQFPLSGYLSYAALGAFWWWARRRMDAQRPESFFAWFVLGTLLIALAGFLLGLGPRPAEQMPGYALRMKLLKFYPFRLMDVMLPVAAAVTLVGLAHRSLPASRRPLMHGGFAAVFVIGLLLPTPERNPSRMPPRQLSRWLAACGWIRENTPADAHVLTPPRESWAFKWYAQRAEYVSYKDCPQDAAGIVEWNRRLNFLRDWAQRHYGDELYSVDELRKLQRKTGITHILTRRLGPFEIEPVYDNGTYRLYALDAVASKTGAR